MYDDPVPDPALVKRLQNERLLHYRACRLSADEADARARHDLEIACETCIESDNLNREPDPDWLFRTARTKDTVRAYLESARADGVTDDDIRAWHSRPYLERAVFNAVWMDALREVVFDFIQRQASGEETAQARIYRLAFWCITPAPPEPVYPVRALAAELYPRYEQWARFHAMAGEQFEFEILRHGSVNDWIRNAAAEGEL